MKEPCTSKVCAYTPNLLRTVFIIDGKTSEPVKNITDSDLLNMDYFLTEDNEPDDNEFKENFYN